MNIVKPQVTLISLGLVAVTSPEKRMTSENDHHSSSSSYTSLNSSFYSNSVSNRKNFWVTLSLYVYDIAHSQWSKEVN